MANVFINEETLTNIANSIRNKTGSLDMLKPSEMPMAIDNISTATEVRKLTLSCRVTRFFPSGGASQYAHTISNNNFFTIDVKDVDVKYLNIIINEISAGVMRSTNTSSTGVKVFPGLKCHKVYNENETTTEEIVDISSSLNIPSNSTLIDLTEENLYQIYFSSNVITEESGASTEYNTGGSLSFDIEFLNDDV